MKSAPTRRVRSSPIHIQAHRVDTYQQLSVPFLSTTVGRQSVDRHIPSELDQPVREGLILLSFRSWRLERQIHSDVWRSLVADWVVCT